MESFLLYAAPASSLVFVGKLRTKIFDNFLDEMIYFLNSMFCVPNWDRIIFSREFSFCSICSYANLCLRWNSSERYHVMSIGKAKCTSSTHLSVEVAVVWRVTVLANAVWAQHCETENHPANLKCLADFFPDFKNIVLGVLIFFHHVLEIYHVSQKISIVSWFLMKFPNFWKNCVLLPKQVLLGLSPPPHPPL